MKKSSYSSPSLSPAESLLSIPGHPYQSLFTETDSANTSDTSATISLEMLSPKSVTEGKDSRVIKQEKSTDPPASAPTKPIKKRKSWGQKLPEPKTNLPPRKRAKTEDEKEQRRVERVLRNRRAAQSSRERKRLEVEALEKRNQELEKLLVEKNKINQLLAEELSRFRRTSGLVTRSPSSLDTIHNNTVTFSQELFGSSPNSKLVDDIPTNLTVDPASLSPNMDAITASPVVIKQEPVPESILNEQTSSGLTQCPAVSHAGGDYKLVLGVANLDSANLGLAPAASDDAAFSLGSSTFSQPYDESDTYVDTEADSSPASSAFGDSFLVDYPPSVNLGSDFEFGDFIFDDNMVLGPVTECGQLAVNHHSELGFQDSEAPIVLDRSNQQPPPGASH